MATILTISRIILAVGKLSRFVGTSVGRDFIWKTKVGEITDFCRDYGRHPDPNAGNGSETWMYTSLETEDFNFARSRTLSNLYLVKGFSSSL